MSQPCWPSDHYGPRSDKCIFLCVWNVWSKPRRPVKAVFFFVRREMGKSLSGCRLVWKSRPPIIWKDWNYPAFFSLLCEEILSQKSHWRFLKVVVVVIATATAVAVIVVVVVFIVFVVPVIWLLKKLIMKWNLIFSRVILKLMHSFETSRHLSFPKAFKGFKASHQ